VPQAAHADHELPEAVVELLDVGRARARAHGADGWRARPCGMSMVTALDEQISAERWSYRDATYGDGVTMSAAIQLGMMFYRPNWSQRTDDPELDFAPGFVLWEACLQLATTVAARGAQCARTTCHASM
jgi:hypothetical protein